MAGAEGYGMVKEEQLGSVSLEDLVRPSQIGPNRTRRKPVHIPGMSAVRVQVYAYVCCT